MKLQEIFQWLLPRDERFKALFREDAENLEAQFMLEAITGTRLV